MKDKPKIKFKDREVRYAMDVELRQDENEEMILEGYALKFNNETLIGSEEYGYREIILPTALGETDMRKVPLKYNHDGGYLALAGTKNGSLELEVDTVGLKFRAKLLDIVAHKDVYEMVRSGLLSECSFAFKIKPGEKGQEWDWEPKIPKRTIKMIQRLFDVALVDIPAYENTEVYARSLDVLEDHRLTVETEKQKVEVLRGRINIKIKLENLEEIK